MDSLILDEKENSVAHSFGLEEVQTNLPRDSLGQITIEINKYTLDHEKETEIHNSDPMAKTFQCSSCQSLHASKGNLIRHINAEHAQSKSCQEAGDKPKEETVSESTPSFKHSKKNPKREIYSEKKKPLTQRRNTKKIIESVELGREPVPVQCEECRISFKSRKRFLRHRGSKQRAHRHYCDECVYSGIGLPNLNAHKENNHNGTTKKYLCDKCDFTATQSYALQCNIERKHLGITFHYCDQCDFIGKYRASVRKHVNTVHKKIKFNCDACDKVFASNDSLKDHKDAAHNDLSFTCSECGDIFKNKINLRKHKRYKHEAPVIQCEFCDYSTTNNDHSKFHTIHKHSDVKFKCKLCRYDTIKAEYLKKHMIKKTRFQ